MHPRQFWGFLKDPVWSKILLFSLILFFIRLSDSVIAFWAPNQIQASLNNTALMGAIISFQSLIGLTADLLFPRLLRTTRVRRLVFWAILASALTSFFLSASTVRPFVAIFIVTMALWGIYYELVNFANYQFMGSAVPLHMRAAAWGFTGIFLNLAYFLGPFIAAELLTRGYLLTQGAIIFFLLAAFLILTLTKKMHDAPTVMDFSDLNPWREFKHWLTLSERIWPVLIISLVLGFIDSTYYTVGTIWTEKLIQVNPWGVWFLPLYLLPFMCLGIPLSTWHIYQGKKKLSEKFLAGAGVLLALIGLSPSIPWQLTIVALSSSALAVCYPLLEGVYSDIIARMQKEKKDMIGLTSSVTNMSYIIWPTFAGLITARVGERMTFSYLGIGVVAVALVLLIVTPRKIRLPEKEIESWD